MIKLTDNKYIIGFDNGYQFGKTANFMFDNGVYEMGKVEPSIKDKTLKYDRRFFKVGEGRAIITEDKLSDERALLLTMAGIAKELRKIGVHKAEIVLAVGLPFSDYGREKKKLMNYYNEKKEMKFEYEGTRFDVMISRVFVFPQCYSAIAPRLSNIQSDYLIIDMGSKTTDLVYLEKGIPVERKSITIEKAMVKWIRQIQGKMQVQYGKDIPESEIIKVLLKEESFLPRQYATYIRNAIVEKIEELKLELKEREYDLDYTNVIFVGGGAVVVKNFSADESKKNIAYDTDIHANAKGYEFLAEQILRRGK